jgi:dihydroorotate dehydrogenase
MYESLLRPLLFRVDPEKAHELGMAAISKGLVSAPSFFDERLSQTLFGVKFPNPIGLAAGFDKNAVAIPYWRGLGFGFAEVGTVTYHAQPGNPRPRLFRFPEERALVNRMGFNNGGAAEVASRVARDLPLAGIPIGVNLGKSKVTSLEDAPRDYAESYRLFSGNMDSGFGGSVLRTGHPTRGGMEATTPAYFIINVSSPNTPGLRSLQEKPALEAIIRALRDAGCEAPLFIKVAPDLGDEALGEVLEVAVENGLTGLIATNTTIQHSHGRGGLSGAPLRERANEVLRFFSSRAPASMVLIGVGGIFTVDDLWERLRAGAHLVQIYTGWIYGGPGLVPRLLEELVARMDQEGIGTVADLRSTNS